MLSMCCCCFIFFTSHDDCCNHLKCSYFVRTMSFQSIFIHLELLAHKWTHKHTHNHDWMVWKNPVQKQFTPNRKQFGKVFGYKWPLVFLSFNFRSFCEIASAYTSACCGCLIFLLNANVEQLIFFLIFFFKKFQFRWNFELWKWVQLKGTPFDWRVLGLPSTAEINLLLKFKCLLCNPRSTNGEGKFVICLIK